MVEISNTCPEILNSFVNMSKYGLLQHATYSGRGTRRTEFRNQAENLLIIRDITHKSVVLWYIHLGSKNQASLESVEIAIFFRDFNICGYYITIHCQTLYQVVKYGGSLLLVSSAGSSSLISLRHR